MARIIDLPVAGAVTGSQIAPVTDTGITYQLSISIIIAAAAAVSLPIAGGTMTGILTLTTATVLAAGTTQGTATLLTAQDNIVTAGSGGVRLNPSATGKVTILNRLATPVNVYPWGTAQIETLGTSGWAVIEPGEDACFRQVSPTQIYASAS
jgi:hypothetical protein